MGSGTPVLVDETGVPELLDDPPTGFDVGRIVGDVGIAHIQPERRALREILPLLDVAEDRVATLGVEFRDSIGLDLRFGSQLQLPLDFQLHRQAVRVPATFARRAIAPHRFVTGEEILKDARQDVVNAGHPVGGRRAFVERVEGTLRLILDAPLEDAARAPESTQILLDLREGHLTGHRLEPCVWHRLTIRRSAPRSRGCPRSGRHGRPPLTQPPPPTA